MGAILLMGVLLTAHGGKESWEKVEISQTLYPKVYRLFEGRPDTIFIFQDPQGTYWIEAWYPDHKDMLPLTPEQWRAFTQGAEIPPMVLQPSHRVGYLIGQTLLGISIYSWSFPAFLRLSEPTANAAIGLFMPFTWFGIHWFETRNRRVSAGEAWGGFSGGVLGAFHGSMLFQSLRGVFPVSVAENLLDRTLARRWALGPGLMQRKVNSHLYGFYHAFLLSDIFSLGLSGASRSRLAASVSLLEGYTALVLSRKTPSLTLGDALFELRLSIIGGEFGPALLTSLFGDRVSRKILLATSLIGQVSAQFLAQQLSVRYDLSVSGALLNALVPYLAHGVTAGVGVLLGSDLYWRSYPILFLATDLGLTWRLYQAFRKPQGSLARASFRATPFVTSSTLRPGQFVYGLQWTWAL